MKKFLGKKAVMWSFLGAAIAFLILYVCLLVRPVTTVTPYKGSYKGQEAVYTFKGGNKLEIKSENSKTEMWVAYDVYSFLPSYVGTDEMTREEFLDEVKDLKKERPETYEEMLIDVNAFRIKMSVGDETITMKNTGAIVFAIVGGIVEAGLITFAVLSILARKKK
ncbi:MAG: hypothetical protein IJ415_01670 [Clostridia bacterium]|nr:hypothetical protein [Clostridia bacterium]